METIVTDKMVHDMVDVIVRELRPKKVILFGSRARGEAGKESDVDFLIVDGCPFGPHRSRRHEAAKIWRALADFLVSKDILLYSVEEVEHWGHFSNHVIGQALREGIVLYEAA